MDPVHEETWNVLEKLPGMEKAPGDGGRWMDPDQENPWNVLEELPKREMASRDNDRWMLHMENHGMFWKTTQHGKTTRRRWKTDGS